MAHADYDCCAICDCKRAYRSSHAKTKDDICVDCREATGVATVNQLLIAALGTDPFPYEVQECFYPNEVDALLVELDLIPDERRNTWHKRRIAFETRISEVASPIGDMVTVENAAFHEMRWRNALMRHLNGEDTTLGDISALSEDDVRQIPQMGDAAVRWVKDLLDQHRLRLYGRRTL